MDAPRREETRGVAYVAVDEQRFGRHRGGRGVRGAVVAQAVEAQTVGDGVRLEGVYMLITRCAESESVRGDPDSLSSPHAEVVRPARSIRGT